MNDSPVDCQSRDVPEPQRDSSCGAGDEGLFYKEFCPSSGGSAATFPRGGRLGCISPTNQNLKNSFLLTKSVAGAIIKVRYNLILHISRWVFLFFDKNAYSFFTYFEICKCKNCAAAIGAVCFLCVASAAYFLFSGGEK